jgi:hypothetical protein
MAATRSKRAGGTVEADADAAIDAGAGAAVVIDAMET